MQIYKLGAQQQILSSNLLRAPQVSTRNPFEMGSLIVFEWIHYNTHIGICMRSSIQKRRSDEYKDARVCACKKDAPTETSSSSSQAYLSGPLICIWSVMYESPFFMYMWDIRSQTLFPPFPAPAHIKSDANRLSIKRTAHCASLFPANRLIERSHEGTKVHFGVSMRKRNFSTSFAINEGQPAEIATSCVTFLFPKCIFASLCFVLGTTTTIKLLRYNRDSACENSGSERNYNFYGCTDIMRNSLSSIKYERIQECWIDELRR
jgi:hypothetical protein